MTLQNSVSFFINQGPVFWAATASVGAGGALLLTACYIYFRRFVRNRFLRTGMKTESVRVASNGHMNPEITVTGTGYALSRSGSMETKESAPSQEHLHQFLTRLRAAGDRMEESSHYNKNTESTHSSLKHTHVPVDYEIRMGAG